jgi:hypothetical protein
LLERYYRYQQTAVEEGQKEATKEYILVRRGDVTAVDKLAHLLAEQGVEVKQADAAFKNGAKDFPRAHVVTAAAAEAVPAGSLEPSIPMESVFLGWAQAQEETAG